MKDIYKNPIAYYIVIPLVIILWPLLVWAVYIPRAEQSWDTEKNTYIDAQVTMAVILALDPDRLEAADPKTGAVKFDYMTIIDKVASACGIPFQNYTINSKPARTSKGQKTQAAKVILKPVDITTFARFLSKLQVTWANLQCEKVSLTKQKGTPDTWKIDLDFKYYY